MVRIAPRYDPRILALAQELDDPGKPMAETCRRVCAAAEEIGITRPSYVHLSRLVREVRDAAEDVRARREAIRAVAGEVAGQLVAGRVPDPAWVARRVDETQRRHGS